MDESADDRHHQLGQQTAQLPCGGCGAAILGTLAAARCANPCRVQVGCCRAMLVGLLPDAAAAEWKYVDEVDLTTGHGRSTQSSILFKPPARPMLIKTCWIDQGLVRAACSSIDDSC